MEVLKRARKPLKSREITEIINRLFSKKLEVNHQTITNNIKVLVKHGEAETIVRKSGCHYYHYYFLAGRKYK